MIDVSFYTKPPAPNAFLDTANAAMGFANAGQQNLLLGTQNQQAQQSLYGQQLNTMVDAFSALAANPYTTYDDFVRTGETLVRQGVITPQVFEAEMKNIPKGADPSVYRNAANTYLARTLDASSRYAIETGYMPGAGSTPVDVPGPFGRTERTTLGNFVDFTGNSGSVFTPPAAPAPTPPAAPPAAPAMAPAPSPPVPSMPAGTPLARPASLGPVPGATPAPAGAPAPAPAMAPATPPPGGTPRPLVTPPSAPGAPGVAGAPVTPTFGAGTVYADLVPRLVPPDPAVARGPMGGVVSASPGDLASYAASTEQYAADRARAATWNERSTPYEKLIEILPKTPLVGFGSNIMTVIPDLLSTLGLQFGEDQSQNLAELNKYAAQIARTSGAAANSEAQLVAAQSANVHTEMNRLAAEDVAKVALSLERFTQGRALLAQRLGIRPELYSEFATRYATEIDPRGFGWDLMTPDERAALVENMSDAELARLAASTAMARDLGLVRPEPPTITPRTPPAGYIEGAESPTPPGLSDALGAYVERTF